MSAEHEAVCGGLSDDGRAVLLRTTRTSPHSGPVASLPGFDVPVGGRVREPECAGGAGHGGAESRQQSRWRMLVSGMTDGQLPTRPLAHATSKPATVRSWIKLPEHAVTHRAADPDNLDHMLKLATVVPPDWFDWLTLVVATLAAVVPAGLAIALWRSDRKASTRERQEAATREFTHLLATGDRVLVRFRDFGYFADAMGPGAIALLNLIDRYMEWDSEDEREMERDADSGGSMSAKAHEPRLDLSVDVNNAIARWNADSGYRADLTEIYLANESVFPEAEDNRIISPTTRRAAEDEILRNFRRYDAWLAGTRLAPSQIRWRRLLDRLSIRRRPLAEPLNSLAANDYLEEEELSGDEWLRARTRATLYEGDE